MDYPYIKCLNPKFIVNRYTGKEILAECGKCESCLMKKSLSSTTKCKLESASNRYTYFVTLTYSNNNLPLLYLSHKYSYPTRDLTEYNVVNEDGEFLGSVFYKGYSDNMLYKKCGTPKYTLPTFNKRHVQLFLKRIRKRFNYEKIRYFVCGEYGPVHFRPHYHLELWFNDERTSKDIIQAVREEWPYGRVDVSLCNGKSAGYISSYINGNMYLPRVFKLPKTKPFSNHSFYLGEQIFQGSTEKIDECQYSNIASRRMFGSGLNTEVILFRTLKTRLMPKCKGYSSLNEHERVLSYQSYEIIRKWTQEDKPINQARFITDYVRYFDFYHEIDEINDLLQMFRHGLGYYERHGDNFTFVQPFLVDYDKFERMVYMIILCSRSFLFRYCKDNVTYGHIVKVIRFIDGFYKYLDYENLKKQLNIEEKISNDLSINNNFMFHNKLLIKNLKESSLFKNYKKSRQEVFKNFIKHKRLNDLNKIFIY